VLHRLTDLGNTIVIIEHNLDVIRNADWIIDLGPEGGEDGGQIIAEGTPEQVSRVRTSYTGDFLHRYYAEHHLMPETSANGNAAPKRRKSAKKAMIQ